MPRLVSVNVGTPQPVGLRRGRTVRSAIRKAPVAGRVRVEGEVVQLDARVTAGSCIPVSGIGRTGARPRVASSRSDDVDEPGAA